jgi:hypothetical protein
LTASISPGHSKKLASDDNKVRQQTQIDSAPKEYDGKPTEQHIPFFPSYFFKIIETNQIRKLIVSQISATKISNPKKFQASEQLEWIPCLRAETS